MTDSQPDQTPALAEDKMVASGAALVRELERRNVVLGSQRPELELWLAHLGAVTLSKSLHL